MTPRKPKAKKPKVKAPQAPQMDLNLFQVQQRADNFGIQITITHQGVPVHVFMLPVVEYQLWQTMVPEQKFAFVRSRTNAGVFENNRTVVNLVIRATINVLDTIFARARARAQAQVQRRVL